MERGHAGCGFNAFGADADSTGASRTRDSEVNQSRCFAFISGLVYVLSVYGCGSGSGSRRWGACIFLSAVPWGDHKRASWANSM